MQCYNLTLVKRQIAFFSLFFLSHRIYGYRNNHDQLSSILMYRCHLCICMFGRGAELDGEGAPNNKTKKPRKPVVCPITLSMGWLLEFVSKRAPGEFLNSCRVSMNIFLYCTHFHEKHSFTMYLWQHPSPWQHLSIIT